MKVETSDFFSIVIFSLFSPIRIETYVNGIVVNLKPSILLILDHNHVKALFCYFAGVYGMWNIYVFGLLSLYAPSHKQFSSAGKIRPRGYKTFFMLNF